MLIFSQATVADASSSLEERSGRRSRSDSPQLEGNDEANRELDETVESGVATLQRIDIDEDNGSAPTPADSSGDSSRLSGELSSSFLPRILMTIESSTY